MTDRDKGRGWWPRVTGICVGVGLAVLSVPAQALPPGYAEWKGQIAGAAQGASRADFTVENTIMRITVNTAAGQYGMFGLTTLGGDPATASDDNKILIYGTSGNTSGLGVKIDGAITSLKNTAPTQASTKSGDSTYSTTEWVVSGVLIRQRLELVDSGNGRADTAKMTYSLTNQAAAAKTVGLKVGIDTMIGDNDDAPIALASGIIAVETGYGLTGLAAGNPASYRSTVPDYWQAFEGTNIATPGLVARGTLFGGGATKPDKFVGGQWHGTGSGVSDSSTFDYQPSGLAYDDSAVGIWWLNRALGVGQTLTFVTYYGLGSVTGAGGDLALNVASPASLTAIGATFDPNPFTVNAIVQNNTGATIASIAVTITLPAGLSLAAGQAATRTVTNLAGAGATQLVSWQVVADTAKAGQTLSFAVNAAGGGKTAHVDRTIQLPTLTGLGPYQVTFTANAGGTLLGTANQTVNRGASATKVTAKPNAGFVFTNWTRRDSTVYATTAAITVTNVQAALDLYASFTATPLPDFVVTNIRLDPAQPGVGTTFTAYVRVLNQGTAAGKVGTVGIWLDKPGADVAAKFKAERTAQSSVGLRPGQSMLFAFTGLAAGTVTTQKTFRAFADAANGALESNETNNQATLVYTIPPPDFTVTAIVISPDYLDCNKTFTAYVTVRNTGVVPGNADFLDVWVNPNPVKTAATTNKGDKFVSVGVLAAGESKRITVTGLKAGLVNGRVQALIDSRAKTAESNENNNSLTVDYVCQP